MILVDKSGRSVIVEGNEIIEKEKTYQIVTNFNLSKVKGNNFPCKRYNDTLGMIDDVDFSVAGFEDILNKVKQNKYSRFPTIYSYIIDIPKKIPNEDYSNYLTKYKIYIENESLYFDDNGVKYRMIPHRKDRFYFDYLDLLVEFNRDRKNNIDTFTTYHKGWGINAGKKL